MFVLGTIYNKQIEIQDELRQLYKHTASREGQARIMSKLEKMQPLLDSTPKVAERFLTVLGVVICL